MINKLYYEKIVRVYKITPKQYQNALMGRSQGGGFWGQVGAGVPWFLWGCVIGTLISAFIVGYYVIYPVMSIFLSSVFGCAPDNPILVAFLTLGISVWLIKGAIYGFDKDGNIND